MITFDKLPNETNRELLERLLSLGWEKVREYIVRKSKGNLIQTVVLKLVVEGNEILKTISFAFRKSGKSVKVCPCGKQEHVRPNLRRVCCH